MIAHHFHGSLDRVGASETAHCVDHFDGWLQSWRQEPEFDKRHGISNGRRTSPPRALAPYNKRIHINLLDEQNRAHSEARAKGRTDVARS